MLQLRELNGNHPRSVKLLIAMNATEAAGLHSMVYEATDPEDIFNRALLDEIGIRVFLDMGEDGKPTGRHFLVGWGTAQRQTASAGMGFSARPEEAIIMYARLSDDQLKIYEKKLKQYNEMMKKR